MIEAHDKVKVSNIKQGQEKTKPRRPSQQHLFNKLHTLVWDYQLNKPRQ